MSATDDLLVEIGTEELPPKALRRLSEAFTEGVIRGLERAGLEHQGAQGYATPRRLAVAVRQLALAQPDRVEERRGPAVAAAFDDQGRPTKAAEGFARSCGVAVEALETLETDKGAWLVHRQPQVGRPAAELIPEVVRAALDALPIPRRMRWSDREAEFVRPVHWVVLLLGNEVVEAEILSVRAGRETRGHRFHRPEPIYMGEPQAYAPLLETEGHVVADFEQRREAIRGQVMEAAQQVHGQARIDEDLLEEVTAMVEWPVAVLGNFDQRFLEIPAEALISTMQGHQKYFPVVDERGTLMPHFVAVANIESRRPEVVRAGNERVIRPRLSDADFFWNQDRKQPLASRLERLQQVVFHRQLGSVYDKAERVAALAAHIARQLGGDAAAAERAGRLAKCDLTTEMVTEFPELQGIMGRYYAYHDGEPEAVAVALEEHYQPRFAGDAPPATATGQAVSVADKLDSLLGLFGAGQPPSGDRDPFALRRAALGVVRTFIEQGLDLDLVALLETGVRGYAGPAAPKALTDPDQRAGVVDEVYGFVMDRLRVYYEDQGIAPDVVEAVRVRAPRAPLDFDARVRAVDGFRMLPAAEGLTAANKRIANILRRADELPERELDERLLEEDSERFLAEHLPELEQNLEPLFEIRDYAHILEQLAGLREPVDAFFDSVMVMAEDQAVRTNRLILLRRFRELFLRVADLSRLQG